MTHAKPSLFPTFALALFAAVFAGCQRQSVEQAFHQTAVQQDIAIDGLPAPAADGAAVPWTGGPLAVDVDNAFGSVTVEVHPGRHPAPIVAATYRWTADKAGPVWNRATPPADVRAAITRDESGFAVLTITAAPREGAPADTAVDLVIETPTCDGLEIESDGGPVVAVGVAGAITIDNGRGFGPGGRIEVRTNKPVEGPVALLTTRGRVAAVVPPTSRFAADLRTDEGVAAFSTKYGETGRVQAGLGRYEATYNNGQDALVMRTQRGDVRVLVHENPELYSLFDGGATTLEREFADVIEARERGRFPDPNTPLKAHTPGPAGS